MHQMLENGILERIILPRAWPTVELNHFEKLIGMTNDTGLRLIGLLSELNLLGRRHLHDLATKLKLSKATMKRINAFNDALEAVLIDDQLPDSRKQVYWHGTAALRDVFIFLAAQNAMSKKALAALEREHLSKPIEVFPLKAADLLEAGMEKGPKLGAKLKAIEIEWVNSGFQQETIDEAVKLIARGNQTF